MDSNLSKYDTFLTPAEEAKFQQWKAQYAPNDSGFDYDLRGAFKEGLMPGVNGHWSDKYKKPNHPTFSDQSMYAVGADAAKAGHWNGDKFVPPYDPYYFNYQGRKINPIDLQYGIEGMETHWGDDVQPRYERKFHQDLMNNKKWIPTPAQKRVIAERGYGRATKEFSTSYGPFQILPETAYRYTSFAGNPEDLTDPAVSTPVYVELITRMHNKSKGDLVKAMKLWNQNPTYLSRMMKLIDAKNKR